MRVRTDATTLRPRMSTGKHEDKESTAIDEQSHGNSAGRLRHEPERPERHIRAAADVRSCDSSKLSIIQRRADEEAD